MFAVPPWKEVDALPGRRGSALLLGPPPHFGHCLREAPAPSHCPAPRREGDGLLPSAGTSRAGRHARTHADGPLCYSKTRFPPEAEKGIQAWLPLKTWGAGVPRGREICPIGSRTEVPVGRARQPLWHTACGWWGEGQRLGSRAVGGAVLEDGALSWHQAGSPSEGEAAGWGSEESLM